MKIIIKKKILCISTILLLFALHSISCNTVNLVNANEINLNNFVEMLVTDSNGNIIDKYTVPLLREDQNILLSSGDDFCKSHNNGDWVECHFSAFRINQALAVSGAISGVVLGAHGKVIWAITCSVLRIASQVRDGIWVNFDIYETEVYYDMYDHYTTYKYRIGSWGWQ